MPAMGRGIENGPASALGNFATKFALYQRFLRLGIATDGVIGAFAQRFAGIDTIEQLIASLPFTGPEGEIYGEQLVASFGPQWGMEDEEHTARLANLRLRVEDHVAAFQGQYSGYNKDELALQLRRVREWMELTSQLGHMAGVYLAQIL